MVGNNNATNYQPAQYNILTGGANNQINNVAPSATSGIPIISQGATSQPTFGTAGVAGGGTGATTLTANGVLLGNGTSAISATSPGTNGQLLIGSTGAAPAFSTATSTGSISFTPGANSLALDISNYVTRTSWTPTIAGDGTAGTATYTTNVGYYTRFLNLVYVTYVIAWSAGTGTGNLVINGLPVNILNLANSRTIGEITFEGSYNFPPQTTSVYTKTIGTSNQQRIYIFSQTNSGGETGITYQASGAITGSLWYWAT